MNLTYFKILPTSNICLILDLRLLLDLYSNSALITYAIISYQTAQCHFFIKDLSLGLTRSLLFKIVDCLIRSYASIRLLRVTIFDMGSEK